jgi:hypothetical protein
MLRTLALVAALTVVACGGGDPATTGASVATAGGRALDDYRKTLAPLIPLEDEALRAISDATGARYTDDAKLLAALRDVALPRYRKFVEGLAAIRPNEQVSGPHGRLRTLAAAELVLLERLERAVGRGDGTAVYLVNSEQRQLRDQIDKLLAEFRAAGGGPLVSGSPKDTTRATVH